MKRNKRATLIAAGCALGVTLAGAGPATAFQAPAVPQAAEPPAAAAPAATIMAPLSAEPEYDTYFEPFTTSRPELRLKQAAPLPPPTPLFKPYEPTMGMDPHTATSRLAISSHAVLSLPILDAKVGDIIDIPLYQLSGPPLTALIFRVSFEAAVLEPIEAVKTGWTSASIIGNASEPVGPGRIFSVVEYGPDPWSKGGQLFNMRFRAIGPGEAHLQPSYLDLSDDSFNNVPYVFRNGLIRVRP